MATITTIQASDQITDSRSDINQNFENLNDDKIETSYLDTDTSLAANSDSKIPTQKAVKAYVDTQGGANASEAVRGVVEEATDGEVTAGTATGGTGAKLFVTPAKLATRLGSFQQTMVYRSGLTTKDVADANGTQTIAHGLGKTPLKVRFRGVYVSTSVSVEVTGVFDGGGQSCIGIFMDEGSSSPDTDTPFTNATALKLFGDATNAFQVGTVTVDSTNISIAWVKTNSPTGSYNILWEAEA